MHPLMHPGEIRDSARRANRFRNVGIFEADRLLEQFVDVGSFDKRMPHASEGVVPLIVREEEDDVRASFSSGKGDVEDRE